MAIQGFTVLVNFRLSLFFQPLKFCLRLNKEPMGGLCEAELNVISRSSIVENKANMLMLAS